MGCARTATGEFDAAEANLSEAHSILGDTEGASVQDRIDALNGLVKLCEVWHSAEPDQGHDAKAVEWRFELTQLHAKQEQVEISTQRFAPPGN